MCTKACSSKHVLSPCTLPLVYRQVSLCDGNHSVSIPGQNLGPGLLCHKKEHNASQSTEAQCSFCWYSESHPSLSPTHICKWLRNVRGGSSGQRIANTYSLAHYNIAFSQWPCLAPLLNISSFPSRWLTCWTHKHMQTQRKTPNVFTHTHTPLCSESTVTRNLYLSHVFMSFNPHYVLMLSLLALFILPHQSISFWGRINTRSIKCTIESSFSLSFVSLKHIECCWAC